ncbi:hypothetical protein EDC01DRAFT_180778 [Geopyxis carbonaria]|nr:hypothetical protein EDC01DRAFT_180778 [Geopyxis carbonaria]
MWNRGGTLVMAVHSMLVFLRAECGEKSQGHDRGVPRRVKSDTFESGHAKWIPFDPAQNSSINFGCVGSIKDRYVLVVLFLLGFLKLRLLKSD